MTTDIKTVAAFIAAAVWADGEFDEAEKICVSEIADALEFDEKKFSDAVDAEIQAVKDMDEYDVNAYLQRAADAVDDEEIGIVYEAVLQIVLTDGKLASAEVSELLAISTALGISDEDAILMLADMVKDEPELEVEL